MEHRRIDRITFDPQIMGGRACIRGMRITVSTVLGLMAAGAGCDEILEDYPYLERADLEACLTYAAWLAREGARRPDLPEEGS